MEIICPIVLIATTYEADSLGQQIAVQTERTVFATVESISQNEFYQAGQGGIKPEQRFSIWSVDYNGEELVKYSGKILRVYRTYQGKDNRVELYVTARAGL